MRRARQSERGQTIPFWLFTVLMVFALMFFLINYANTIRWQIRAQNAADSSAVAKISQDAALLNSTTILLYALDLQNLKLSGTLASVENLLGGKTSCGLVGIGCVGNLLNVVTNTVQALNQLPQILNQAVSAEGQLANLASNPLGTLNGLTSASCVKLSTDCAFAYTTVVTPFPNGAPPLTVQIDEYTCRKITNVAAAFLHIGSPFYAVGHASIRLSPLSNTLFPGSTKSLTSGLPDVPVQQLIPGLTDPGLQFNPAPLQANVGLLLPVPASDANVPPGTLPTVAALQGTCAS